MMPQVGARAEGSLLAAGGMESLAGLLEVLDELLPGLRDFVIPWVRHTAWPILVEYVHNVLLWLLSTVRPRGQRTQMMTRLLAGVIGCQTLRALLDAGGPTVAVVRAHDDVGAEAGHFGTMVRMRNLFMQQLLRMSPAGQRDTELILSQCCVVCICWVAQILLHLLSLEGGHLVFPVIVVVEHLIRSENLGGAVLALSLAVMHALFQEGALDWEMLRTHVPRFGWVQGRFTMLVETPDRVRVSVPSLGGDE